MGVIASSARANPSFSRVSITRFARSCYEARISRMVKDGRGILKQALGEEDYRAYMEEKRAELEHWQMLSKDEQDAIQMEENFGLAPGDAYEIVDEQDYRDYMKAKRSESPEKS